MHGIAVNQVHDEIIVPNPLAGAILIFRGQASGNEAPIRVIQGPKTGLIWPHAVAADVVNDEILVTDPISRVVFTFARTANGDVAPLRAIRGPKMSAGYIGGVAVDSTRNLILVQATTLAGSGALAGMDNGGILLFNRMDDGDVAPRSTIKGPKTGLGSPFQVAVYNDKIVASVLRSRLDLPYNNDKPKLPEQLRSKVELRISEGVQPPRRVSQDPTIIDLWSPWDSSDLGFLGVWNITDNGDVPPMLIVRGPSTGLIQPGGIAIDPKYKVVFASDSPTNSVLTFFLPEIFEHTSRRVSND